MDISDLVDVIQDYSRDGGRKNPIFRRYFTPYEGGNKREYVLSLMEETSDSLTNEDFLSYLIEQVVQPNDIIKYSTGHEILKNIDENQKMEVPIKFVNNLLVGDTFLNSTYKKSKAGYALLLSILKIPVATFEYSEVNTLQGSDVQDALYNQDVYGDFSIEGKVDVLSGLGFFIKQLPDYENTYKHRFNFNDNDDNLFCPFTALYKQDKNNILPVMPTGREGFYEIYRRCGFDIVDTFHLPKNKMFTLYDNFCREYNLNIELKCYYFKNLEKDEEPKHIKLSEVSSKLFKFRYNLSVPSLTRFNIARVRGHIFNVLGGTETKKTEYLNYLNMVNCRYFSLPFKDKDIKKLSREYAQEYNEFIRKRNSDNSQLLLNAEERLDSLYEETVYEEEKEEKTTPYVFIYDLETVNDEKDKFWVYSYYIKCISHDIKDDFKFTVNSDIVRQVNLGDEVVKIIDSLFIKMMEYIITYVPDNSNVILLAHNGSNFDNIIVRELMMSSFGFYDIKEVCAGENQGILLSIECQYRYYKRIKKSNKYNPIPDSAFEPGMNYKSINISLRDSKKIINYAVKDLPDSFAVNAYKLPYDYEFYQKFIIDHDQERITPYRMRNLFKMDLINTESQINNIRKDMSKYFKDKFIDDYIEIITFKYTDKLTDSEFKKDILKYIEVIKKNGKYYDIELYCALYNKYDVLVVAESLKKFQMYINSLSSYEKMCEMITLEIKDPEKQRIMIDKLPKEGYIKGSDKINVYEYRSLASIVFDLCVKYGVYDNIYKLKGDLKLFVQASVVGGRVMCGDKHHNKIKNYDEVLSYVGKEVTKENNERLTELLKDGVLDFDAVGLYSSAISITKMPAGKPKIYNLSNSNNKRLPEIVEKLKNSTDKFFICCDLETRKDLKYPLLSELVKKDNSTTRKFRNGKFEKIVIGDQTFKDLIHYQDAKILHIYTLVSFPSVSDTFSKFIVTLFNLRLILKSMGLACQVTVKDLMNCSYGRTILKQSYYKTKYFKFASTNDKRKFTNFLSKNFHLIKPEINCYGTIYKKLSVKDSSTPQGYPHVGSAILETSKSLMHKAFNLLNDEVFYTDTDSMHILASDLSKVESIIGKNMCQFHSDFDPSTKNNKCEPVNPKYGITAIESIFVMKKCYYDELFCIDSKTNTYCIREHKRVKGVPSGFMDKDKYLRLINGEELTCNLNEYCHMMTKKNKVGELVKINKFSRTIKQIK